METFYYYYIVDHTSTHLKGKYKYKSFLMALEKIHYPYGLYFTDQESMIIRTSDSYEQVTEKVKKVKAKCISEQKVPIITYNLYDAMKRKFRHPDQEEIWMKGDKLYAFFAARYFEDTGIDLFRLQISQASHKGTI